MQVHLAGYNVDASVLSELQKKAGTRNDITPEVLSAAYARISRDPRSITEIREDAKSEVERTRKSNSTIIFKMGHHSVAEHAVFNLDLIGISRLVMEEIEKFRLSSYTEKSQRYITLNNDFVIPQEIAGTPHESLFTAMIKKQNEAYFALLEKLQVHVFKKHADLAADPKNTTLLEGWAKEDARYITALATESQVGMTINARNLELLLRRFASHPLAEVQQVGRMIFDQIVEIAPSIVIFHNANDRDRDTYPQLRELTQELISDVEPELTSQAVSLVEYTQDADTIIAAALLHTTSDLPYDQCRALAASLSVDEMKNIFHTAWRNMQFYDSMLREFEYVNLTYAIACSSACFGQLKRHRMATITTQSYDPRLGVTIPEAVFEVGMQSYFEDIVAQTEETYDKLKMANPLIAPYILTNAHRKRVLMRVNARELYHISRLREDAHAQWDIQNVSRAMAERAKKVMPLTCEFIGGKDIFNLIYQDIFGTLPKVTEAALPGKRKIKEK